MVVTPFSSTIDPLLIQLLCPFISFSGINNIEARSQSLVGVYCNICLREVNLCTIIKHYKMQVSYRASLGGRSQVDYSPCDGRLLQNITFLDGVGRQWI